MLTIVYFAFCLCDTGSHYIALAHPGNLLIVQCSLELIVILLFETSEYKENGYVPQYLILICLLW